MFDQIVSGTTCGRHATSGSDHIVVLPCNVLRHPQNVAAHGVGVGKWRRIAGVKVNHRCKRPRCVCSSNGMEMFRASWVVRLIVSVLGNRTQVEVSLPRVALRTEGSSGDCDCVSSSLGIGSSMAPWGVRVPFSRRRALLGIGPMDDSTQRVEYKTQH